MKNNLKMRKNNMNNKQLGSKIEQDFAKYLSSLGFWVHLIAGGSHTRKSAI